MKPALALVLVAALVAGCGKAEPAKPANDVFSIARDGSDLRNLTSSPTTTEQLVSVGPDGRTLAFFRDGRLIVRSGSAERVLDRHYENVTDWGASPAWSPDGRKLAVTKGTRCAADDGCEHWPLWVVDVRTGDRRRVARDGVLPWWLADGRLGFTGAFKWVACECASQFERDPTRLLVGGRSLAAGEEPAAAAWRDGLVYTATPSRGLYAMASDGTHRRRLVKQPVEDVVPSRDGRQLAFGCEYGRLCILVPGRRSLSTVGHDVSAFAWSRDGRFLAWAEFACPSGEPPCTFDLYVAGREGSSRRITHNELGARIDAIGWTADGQIVFSGTGIVAS